MPTGNEIISPRRGEPISLDGFPTVRFIEYIERVAKMINGLEDGTTVVSGTGDVDDEYLHFWMRNR